MPPRPFLLDTNVLVHLSRQNETGKRINEQFKLTSNWASSLISVVTVAEMLVFASKWGKEKRGRMEQMLGDLVTVDIGHRDILERFAEIKVGSKGLTLGDNDLWIAATASVTDAILLTCDKDFIPLDGQYLQCIWIDPRAPNA